MTSVTFSRDLVAGAPGDLTIGTAPFGSAYWIPEGGITEPEFDVRSTFADESPDVAGTVLLQSALGLGTLALNVYAQADDAATLKARKRALEAVVRQFTYTATLSIVGDPDTYACLPGQITWGATDSGMVAARLAQAVLTIPVQPWGV